MRCVFFDRDGIVNASPGGEGYVTRWEDFRLMPEFPECLRIAARHNYRAAIVTNQRCVEKGLLSAAALEEIHQRLQARLNDLAAPPLLEIVYCPHGPDMCDCRKPLPGMLLQLAERHRINLVESWMVGDRETDVETGRRAGCRTILVNQHATASKADHIVPDMRALTELLPRVLQQG